MHGMGVCYGGCVAGVRVGETATETGGTHPTGMHYCIRNDFPMYIFPKL